MNEEDDKNLDELNKELDVQKEKYENMIKDMKKIQLQGETDREKEKKKLRGLIKQYEKLLDNQTLENKKLKEKEKELENTLAKMRNNK